MKEISDHKNLDKNLQEILKIDTEKYMKNQNYMKADLNEAIAINLIKEV